MRGLTAGAIESIVIDAEEEFLTDFAFEALKANALYEGKYPLHSGAVAAADLQEDGGGGPPVGRQVRRARLHRQGQRPGAHGRVHPLPRPGHHRPGPGPRVGHDPAAAARLPGRAGHRPAAHQEEPLLHRREPLGPRHRVWRAGRPLGGRRRRMPTSSRSTRRTRPTRPKRSSSASRRGIPVAIDGETMGPVELVEKTGPHRRARTASAASTWWRTAWWASRAARSTRSPVRWRSSWPTGRSRTWSSPGSCTTSRPGIDQRLTELIYDGLWFSPLAYALRAFIDETPEVRDRRRPAAVLQGLLQAGRAGAPRTRSTTRKLATYGSGDTFSHESAKGFIHAVGPAGRGVGAQAPRGDM